MTMQEMTNLPPLVDDLPPEMREDVARLRDAADRSVLRRSYAAALLKWRGYAVSFPEA